MIDLNWLFLLNLAMQDPRYKIALACNYTKFFLNDMSHRLKTGKNFIYSFHGIGGAHKSYSGIYLALRAVKYGMKFDIDHCCWSSEQFLEKMQNIKGKETFLIDERVGLEQYGVGASRIEDAIASIENIARKPQVNIIYCSIRKMSGGDQHRLWSQNLLMQNRYSYHILFDTVKDHPYGHIYLDDPRICKNKKDEKDRAQFILEYENLKDQFNSQVFSGNVRNNIQYILDMADKFMLENYHMFKNKYNLHKKKELSLAIKQAFPITMATGEWDALTTEISARISQTHEKTNAEDL